MTSKLVGILVPRMGVPTLLNEFRDDQIESQYDEPFKLIKEISWIGFYDWLWKNGNEIAGVRVTLDDFEDLRFFEGFQHITLVPNLRLVTIFLNADHCFDGAFDATQAFGGNSIYIGNAGSLIVSFYAP